MIKVENIEVMNLRNAVRGMRNPLESWDMSDSDYCIFLDFDCPECPKLDDCPINDEGMAFIIGEKDLALAKKLVLAGPDHSKFMRQIFVSMDITTSLYWFKEFDTYKVGTTANSESTMHKIASKPITRDCFSFDKELDALGLGVPFEGRRGGRCVGDTIDYIIYRCEELRQLYVKTKDVRYWRALIQLLPSSWNQTRTWTGSYANLRNMYFSRKEHKLSEWRKFCRIIEGLPYAKELICAKKEEEKETIFIRTPNDKPLKIVYEGSGHTIRNNGMTEKDLSNLINRIKESNHE